MHFSLSKTITLAIFCCAMSAGAVLAEVTTPQPGTQERGDILDAVRVMVGYDLGGPIEFTGVGLQIENGFGFVQATATRPGGQAININETPLVLRDGVSPDFIDGTSVQAFITQAGGDWYVHAYAVGATDVWWIGDPYCTDYAAFLPEQAC